MICIHTMYLPDFSVGAYKVGLNLQVEFEFRTTRTNGVLLGISSQKMDGLGIELVDENVSFQKSILHLITLSVSLAKPIEMAGLEYGRPPYSKPVQVDAALRSNTPQHPWKLM